MKNIFALFILFSNLCFGQVDLTHGLKAYYPFSGNANDESGNNNHPVFNNAALTADRFGNPVSAYHFNGKNTYMKILNSPGINMGNKMSISLWVKPMGFYTGKCYNNILLMKGDADYLAGNYSLRFSDVYTGCTSPTTKTERFYDGSGSIATFPLVKLNQWYNVTVTCDGKTSRLYINCVLQGSSPSSVSYTNGYDLYFGHANSVQYPYWLNGGLDEVRIYNRALNEDEIFALCERSPAITKAKPVKKIQEKKNKDIAKQKTEVTAPQTVNESNPLVANKEAVELKAGVINPLNFDNENEIVLENRTNDLVKEIAVDNDSISVTLYDNGIIDGDSITLIYNNKILTAHQLLTEKPLTFYIKITPGNSQNELVMYAENLGSIPPNTALMVIYDGNKRYELNVSSSKTSNGVVSFKLRQ